MELYEFQEDFIRDLKSKAIYAADTGVGKSVMSLAHYDRVAYPSPLLIVGPAAKMRTEDWQREVASYFGNRPLPEIAYYSYEKLSRRPTPAQVKKTGRLEEWREWIDAHPSGYAVIWDEGHRAANPQSLTGLAMFELSKRAIFFVGLTATPLPNGWISAANYFKMAGFVKNITEFKKRYCNIQTFKGFPEIVGYYRESELQERWSAIAKPLRKEDAIDLPPLTIVEQLFPITKEYTDIQKRRILGDKILDNPSALLHALRQATAPPKLPWLSELIEGANDHLVIFYNYISEREAILKMLRKDHKGRVVIRQDGDRHEIPHKEDWGKLPERTITLAQYQSGSTGVEMQYASLMVHFSPTYSYTLYKQSLGRLERIGQKSKITSYNLYAPASIERHVWGALHRKQDFQGQIWLEEQDWYGSSRKT